MKRQIPLLLAASAALGASFTPVQAQPWFRGDHLRVEGARNAENCSDLRASAAGEIAKGSEKFTLSKREAPALEVRPGSHSALHVRGWNHSDYEVEVCKFAAASTRSEANRLLRSIEVRRDGARVTTGGPELDHDWEAVVLVHAPQDAVLNLESGNAPVNLAQVNGKVTVHATNGPVAFRDCSGTIDAETTNGPISFRGAGGDVHLRAFNGPISLELTDAEWRGPVLDASTSNGPISARLADGFRSGLRVETSGHVPVHCRADVCSNARTVGARFFPRLLQAGSGDVVRLSTHNGPVSIAGPGRHARAI